MPVYRILMIVIKRSEYAKIFLQLYDLRCQDGVYLATVNAAIFVYLTTVPAAIFVYLATVPAAIFVTSAEEDVIDRLTATRLFEPALAHSVVQDLDLNLLQNLRSPRYS